MTIHAYTDGASRGNPGESGIGVILKDENGTTLDTFGEYIGRSTNNHAEYRALLKCLELAGPLSCAKLIVHSDSELMVRQLLGEYRVKDAALREQFERVQSILRSAPFAFEIRHVVRDENREADELANRSINLKTSIR
ncbi:MAG: ribonuclease HI family protein [Bacteroidota bacterium]